MPFRTILKELTERSRGKGAIMLDKDGESVAEFSEPGVEIDLIGAHHGIILHSVKENCPQEEPLKSITITTSSTNLVISALKDGYYVVLAIDRPRPAGKALFEIKRAAKKIEVEMG